MANRQRSWVNAPESEGCEAGLDPGPMPVDVESSLPFVDWSLFGIEYRSKLLT